MHLPTLANVSVRTDVFACGIACPLKLLVFIFIFILITKQAGPNDR